MKDSVLESWDYFSSFLELLEKMEVTSKLAKFLLSILCQSFVKLHEFSEVEKHERCCKKLSSYSKKFTKNQRKCFLICCNFFYLLIPKTSMLENKRKYLKKKKERIIKFTLISFFADSEKLHITKHRKSQLIIKQNWWKNKEKPCFCCNFIYLQI